jgi:hypothetical protein
VALAELWQEILLSSHEDFFSGAADGAMDRSHGYDRLPQPGYVGRHYDGGVVLIAQNPGNGEQDGLGPPNLRQYALLGRIKEADEWTRQSAFEDAMLALETEVMCTWRIVQNLVEPLLQKMNLLFDQVAFLNFIKFRTEERAPTKLLYDRAWPYTSMQIKALRPKFIIALGKNPYDQMRFRAFDEDGRNPQLYRVRRRIGDYPIPKGPSGDDIRADICAVAAAWRSVQCQ